MNSEKNTLLAIKAALNIAGKLVQRAGKDPASFLENVSTRNPLLADASLNEQNNEAALFIQRADGIASGHDREYAENESYSEARITPLTGRITLWESTAPAEFRMDIAPFSRENIFPKIKSDLAAVSNGYAACAKELEDGVEILSDNLKVKEDLVNFAFGLDTLLLKTAMNAPAWSTCDDVSLYDHAKTVAAFAAALRQYHGRHPETSLDDNLAKKFLLIRGSFCGIQNFIFNKEQSNENPSKILRGKSFYISLTVETVTLMLMEELELTPFNIMFNAAGSFVILAGNTPEGRKSVEDAKELINSWLYKKYYGTVAFVTGTVEASESEIKYSFNDLWQELIEKTDREKQEKFSLSKRKAVFDGFHRGFDGAAVCKYCGINPAAYDGVCRDCDEFIKLGDNLAKKDVLHIFRAQGGDFFGRFSYSFDKRNDSAYTIELDMDRSFGGMRQTHYKTYQKLSGNGSIVSFEELAGNDEGAGILAALKADVDNLGAIFACGLCDEKGAQESGNTFSRFSSLSRSFHHFFSYYISRLAAEKEYKVYTVFAGGDELFIVGNFKDIVDLSLDITEKFRQYSGGNKEVTLSAGIVFCGANTPIWYMAEEAESLLGTAKTLREGEKEKGRLAIADYAGKWEEFRKEKKAFEEFLGSLHKEIKSSGFFYRLLSFSDMSINTKEEKGGLKLHNLMWRPYLRYMVGRLNKLDDDGRKSVCEKLHRWIDEKPELLKALVSLEIYKNRKGGRK